MNDPLESPKLKIERAKHHIQDLNRVAESFSRSEPYTLVEDINPQNGKCLVKAKLISRVPSNIKSISGDAISNLRSSLDQIACALAEKNGRGLAGVYFPTGDNAKEFNSPETQKKINKLSPDAITFINALEPYGGGKGENLMFLNKLEATNKHKRYVAIGHANQKLIFTNGVISGGPQGGSTKFHGGKWNPTDESVELFTRDPGIEFNCDMTVSFNIAFGEIEGLSGKPIVSFFQKTTEDIEEILLECEKQFF